MKVEEEKSDKSDEKTSLNNWIRVLLAGSGAMFIFVFTGITEAQSAVMLPQLKEPDSFIKVTPDDESWIAGLGILCSPLGAMVCGPFMDAFGRKKGLQLFFLTMCLGFGVIAAAQQVWHIFVGRTILAFGVGFEVSSVVYLAEISNKKQRTSLLGIINAYFCCGVTLTYVIGYLPWNVASAIFSAVCLAFSVSGFFVPESPQWLIKQNRDDEAISSFMKLGKTRDEIEREIKILKETREEEAEKISLKLFLDPRVWKPLLILSIFHSLDSACGLYNLLYYTVDFIKDLRTTYNELYVTILISLIRVVTSCTIGMYFNAKVGRRPATIISGILMACGTLGTGIYTYMFRNVPFMDRSWQMVPIACQILYLTSSTIGILPLPWTMSGEVFPLKVRGLLNGIVFVIGSLSIFISIKMYLVWVSYLQIYGYLFSITVPCFLAVLFGYFILPETQNKTLQEIEDGFVSKKKRQRSVETADASN